MFLFSRKPKDFFLLYDEYYPKLYAYVLARLRHREVTEDVVQQVFEKAFANLVTFVPRKGATFGSWLFAIARHELVNVVREQRRVVLSDQEFLERIPLHETFLQTMLQEEAAQEEREVWAAILAAMDTLDDDEREVLTLKYLAGMSYDDISTLMHKKPNTLAVMLKRSLEKIRVTISVCKK
jgi:RNA polymerase sigma-70 factor, ECF subfamily